MTALEQNNADRIKALIQIDSEHYGESPADVIGVALCRVFIEEGLELPIAFYKVGMVHSGEYMSVRFVEDVCSKGYEAVINDGELIAFKKAV